MVYILHECVVYIPADALEGLELIDAPGTGVVSPQEQKALQDVLQTADALVVCMQRNLQHCKDIKPHIQSCVLFQKLIETTAKTPGAGSPCQVFFFSAMDEQGNFTRLDTPELVNSDDDRPLKRANGTSWTRIERDSNRCSRHPSPRCARMVGLRRQRPPTRLHQTRSSTPASNLSTPTCTQATLFSGRRCR